MTSKEVLLVTKELLQKNSYTQCFLLGSKPVFGFGFWVLYYHVHFEEDYLAIWNLQVDSPRMCGLMSGLVICKHRKHYGHT